MRSRATHGALDAGLSVRSAVVEAGRNLRSRPAVSGLLISIVLSSALAIFVVEYNATTRIVRDTAQMVDRGFATYVLSSTGPAGHLTAKTCSSLRVIPAVEHAVWMRRRGEVKLFGENGESLPAWEADGDLDGLLGAASGRSIFVDSRADVAPREQRQWVVRDGGDYTAVDARAVDLSPWGAGLEGNVISRVHLDGNVDACLLFARVNSRGSVALSVRSLIPATSGISQGWALPASDLIPAPQDAFAARPSRLYYLIGAAVVAVLFAMSLLMRRSERGLYVVVGFRPHQVGAVGTAELALIWTVAASLMVAIVITKLAWSAPDSVRFAVRVAVLSALRFALLSLLSCLALVWFSCRLTGRSAIAALKDR